MSQQRFIVRRMARPSDYSDKEEFYEACRELHKDEEDAEYMFQDWENVPEGLIDESWISENFFCPA